MFSEKKNNRAIQHHRARIPSANPTTRVQGTRELTRRVVLLDVVFTSRADNNARVVNVFDSRTYRTFP